MCCMLFLKWNTEYTAVYKGVYLLKENKLYENELHQCKGLHFFLIKPGVFGLQQLKKT